MTQKAVAAYKRSLHQLMESRLDDRWRDAPPSLLENAMRQAQLRYMQRRNRISFKRSLSRMQSMLAHPELWQQGRGRVTERLRRLVGWHRPGAAASTDSAHGPSTSGREAVQPASELEALFGTNGILRVSRLLHGT